MNTGYNIFNLYDEYMKAQGYERYVYPTEPQYSNTITELLKNPLIRSQIKVDVPVESLCKVAFLRDNGSVWWWYRLDDIVYGKNIYEDVSIPVHYIPFEKPNRVFIGEL